MQIDLTTIDRFRVTAQNMMRDYQLRGMSLDDLVTELTKEAAAENINISLGGPYTIDGPFDLAGSGILDEVKQKWANWAAAGKPTLPPLKGFGRY